MLSNPRKEELAFAILSFPDQIRFALTCKFTLACYRDNLASSRKALSSVLQSRCSVVEIVKCILFLWLVTCIGSLVLGPAGQRGEQRV